MKKILATSTFGDKTIIPKIVTEILKLDKGDQILFVIDEKDNIILKGPKID